MMTQNLPPPIDLKVLQQQRKILAMMGVDVWIQRSSPTFIIDIELDDALMSDTSTLIQSPKIAKTIELSVVDNPSNQTRHETSTSTPNSPTVFITSKAINSIESEVKKSGKFGGINKGEIPNNAVTNAIAYDDELGEDRQQSSITDSQADSQEGISVEQVLPFDLMGVHYHGWVLLVDSKFLKDDQVVKLWHSMLQTLSLTPEHLQFPICEGIADKESADASVAGFVFRLGRRKNASIAVLTPMPDALDNQSFIRVPYLTEMLDDSRQKKQLWQLISKEDN